MSISPQKHCQQNDREDYCEYQQQPAHAPSCLSLITACLSELDVCLLRIGVQRHDVVLDTIDHDSLLVDYRTQIPEDLVQLRDTLLYAPDFFFALDNQRLLEIYFGLGSQS